jgi:BirA family biotin operon repressor/biotin-[acetyl-CoA-carboxylase] ligase
MNSNTERVIQRLKQEAGWISGEAIGAGLGISRNAVSKHIHTLRGQGYRIAASPRRGYRLEAEPNRPSAAEVVPLLNTQFIGRALLYREQVDSTNRLAADEARRGAPEGTTVVADSQTAGRGRLQRQWYSPAGTNVYFSVVLRPAVDPARVSELPLVAAVALLKTLDRLYPEVEAAVKWPNDLMAGGRKLCGMLCESALEIDRVQYVVIGIGLNANARSFPSELQSRATSLYLRTGQEVSRAGLLAAALDAFEADYRRWTQASDLEPFLPYLESHSMLTDRMVTVQNVGGQVRGRVAGLAANGALRLQTPEGVRTVVSGDVTLTGWGAS